ncbi:MAG: prepilin-type N-terminal cleavage/methylation domain-containing protein [Planctomycetaceae bacterium]|jgi:prepilin-type N-terminal cleavage/methylation domain-containing protein|nr:prepilin-type N-terminal cleavage/methylation domain-containing protein [Planctomycetaceae bacterium]
MKNYKSGMTLLEVIASMFIICIGLLSVLMVIPYGAYQVSKARNAEYISNMLAAGAEDLQIAGWNEIVTKKEGVGKADFGNSTTAKIHILDPFVTYNLDNDIFETLENTNFKEAMSGKDDILYILKEDARTEITDNRGSGQYSYFVTIKPKQFVSRKFIGLTNNFDLTQYETITAIEFTTDLLGCYQRVDTGDTDDPGKPFEVIPESAEYYLKAAKFTIDNTINDNKTKINFSNTKYVFLTWTTIAQTSSKDPRLNTTQRVIMRRGEWCKIVSANNNNGKQDIIVLSNDVASIKNSRLAENLPDNNVRIFVFPGVMYHKRIYD